MKQLFLKYLGWAWVGLVLCFDEYKQMKKQQIIDINDADESGDPDKIIALVEKL